jgi:hypothetical protein
MVSGEREKTNICCRFTQSLHVKVTLQQLLMNNIWSLAIHCKTTFSDTITSSTTIAVVHMKLPEVLLYLPVSNGGESGLMKKSYLIY